MGLVSLRPGDMPGEGTLDKGRGGSAETPLGIGGKVAAPLGDNLIVRVESLEFARMLSGVLDGLGTGKEGGGGGGGAADEGGGGGAVEEGGGGGG